MLPGMELMNCPNMAVPREVMHHVVRVESSYNPYAIGVVGGRLVRQPRSLPEALATVRMLEDRGYNFSLGLAQVNRYNLIKYGLDSYHKAFQPCANLVAGSQILRECYGRSGGDWGKSFSCYYSGDFKTGYRHGYVQKVYASMRRGLSTQQVAGVQPIQVVDRATRRITANRRNVASMSDIGAPLSDVARRRSAPVMPSAAPTEAPVVGASAPEGQAPENIVRTVARPTAQTTPAVRVFATPTAVVTRAEAVTPAAAPVVGSADAAFVF